MRDAQLSPYDLGPQALNQVLKKVLASFVPDGGETALRMMLPTLDSPGGPRPVPSFAFLASEDEAVAGDGSVELGAWIVSAVVLAWREAFELFGLAQEKRLAPEVFAAEDLLRFAETFRYAGALVARGRYLPALAGADGGYDACWTPAIDGAELRRVQLLAERLPPVACCGLPPRDVVEALIRECVDHLVRASVVTTLSRAQAEKGKYYSAHDAWFAALRGNDRRVRWPQREELQALEAQLDLWRRPAEGGRGRLEQWLFQLAEPPTPDAAWLLHAQRVGPNEPAAAEPPLSEEALISLGQAVLLFPPLAAAEAHPGGLVCRLRAPEAHHFLTVGGPLLAASGFDVRLPPTLGAESENLLTLAADVSSQAPESEPSPDRLLSERVAIRWSVLLNGEPVSEAELAALLQADSPLVHFRGRWMRINLH